MRRASCSARCDSGQAASKPQDAARFDDEDDRAPGPTYELAERAAKRREAGDVWVVPILVRPCSSQGSIIADFTVLPKNKRPISAHSDADIAMAEIVEELTTIVNDLPLSLQPRV